MLAISSFDPRFARTVADGDLRDPGAALPHGRRRAYRPADHNLPPAQHLRHQWAYWARHTLTDGRNSIYRTAWASRRTVLHLASSTGA